MQHHSIANPLYFLRYYGCINNPNDPLTAFLINEELDADLDNEVFKTWIREKIDIVAYLETILQMSYSVKIVHELGMNHFDIKPDNYMLITKSGTLRNKEDNYFLIKLIDYGLVGKVGKREQRGTPHFMDPLLLSEKSGHHNDIYSLGLTIYCILKSCSEIRLNRLQDLIENQGMTLMNGRVDTMTDRLNEEIRDLKANNQNASIVAKLEQLYSIIISMVSSDKQDRPNIQTIISDLQSILQQLEPTSLYLTENNAELKEFFYPSFNEGEEPFIWDDGSTNLDDEISNLDEVTSLSNTMQQHESIINNFNLIQNVHDGNEINFDHLQDSMQIEKNMEMVSAQTVRVNIDFNRPVVFDDRYGLVNIGDIGRPLETEISEASSKNMIRI